MSIQKEQLEEFLMISLSTNFSVYIKLDNI